MPAVNKVGANFVLPAITVIIPTIDSLGTLPALVNKILPQMNRERDELLFLDTESVDGTLDYLERIDFPKKMVITVRRGTFSHGGTRMQGAKAALGEIVVFLSDDVVPAVDNFLEELVRPVAEGMAAAACGVSQINPEQGDPLRAQRYNSWYHSHPSVVGPLTTEQWGKMSPRERFTCCRFDDCASCYDRSVLLSVRFPEVAYGEDIGVAKRLLLSGYKIAIAKGALFHHWHRVSFVYLAKRMCIDQHIIRDLFGLIFVKNIPHLLIIVILQTLLYVKLGLFRERLLLPQRIYWIGYSLKYIAADNFGKYIGAIDPGVPKWRLIRKYLLNLKMVWIETIKRESLRKDLQQSEKTMI